MRRRGGLGRGLESLIPTGAALADGDPAEASALDTALRARLERFRSDEQLPYRELPLELIDANPRQPRKHFEDEPLTELTDSIRAVGILQPVVVRPKDGRYQLIMGERRLRAASAAGLRSIPAVLRETSDENLLRDALVENIHRENLNPLEEAAAYEQLLADFEVSQEELAKRLGKSRPAITNALRLLRLPISVQRRVAAGTLSAGHARALVAVGDPALQEQLADRVVAEGLTVRQTEELASLAAMGHDVVGDERPATRQRARMQAPGLVELADRLSDRLDTRVKVQMGKQKGKVLIEFATLDDLQRICDAIGLDGRDQETAGASP
jgi:ParB family chromosome partitioning protein